MAPAAVASLQPVSASKANQMKLPALIPRRRKAEQQNPLPVPEAPPLVSPRNAAELTPQIPSRRILSSHDHDLFLQSATKTLILAFIFSLADSCRDSRISSAAVSTLPPIATKLLAALSSIADLVKANPPEDQGASRFGNPAFRSFIDDMTDSLPELHHRLDLPGDSWIAEVSPYLENAFGSRQRIDYGSGHELNFAMWLLCLNRLSILPQSSFSAVALVVFPKYISLLREIQSTYYLEPAGSHGVWGLDDYQFLPFLLGASQLSHHPYITPRAIHNDLVLEEEGGEFMYLDMVRYTVSTKTVKGLKWTQPMLDDISGAKNWDKVEQGMRRMFEKEVLGKLPIMQHFLFGSLIPATESMGTDNGQEIDVTTDGEHHNGPGHVHRDDTWGDCCGIKIPSTVAAGIEARKNGAGQGLRRIPFD